MDRNEGHKMANNRQISNKIAQIVRKNLKNRNI